MSILNFGSLNIDNVFQVDKIALGGQTIDSLSRARYPGGKGLNQSLAIAKAGAVVYHAGLIGSDGEFLRKLLEDGGVDCRYLQTVDTETGSAFIQVDSSGQNCIVLSGGANRANTPALCEQVLRDFGPGDFLLLQNEINCLSELIDLADAKGITVVLNPSPMNEAVLACALEKVSMFVMNEDEGAAITGEQMPQEILAQMAKRFPKAQVVLTLGSHGSVYAGQGCILEQPAIRVQAVDTTGAGDTYTGYFLAAFAAGLPIKTCMYRATLASAVAVTRKGAASSIPSADELAVFAVEGGI